MRRPLGSRLLRFIFILPFRLPGNQRFFGRKSRAFPLIQPRKIWPGDAQNGDRLTKGHFRFLGQQVNMALSTWYPIEVGRDWLKNLHSFNWLDDLRASDAPQAQVSARALTLHWIEDHRRYRAKSWDVPTLATRLTQWMMNFDFLSSSADPTLQRILLRSTTQQYRYLARLVLGPIVGRDVMGGALVGALKALILVGYCLPGSGQTITRALNLLEQTLDAQIYADGSHIERCPATQMRLLLDILDIRSAMTTAGSPPPVWINTALKQMAGFLRLLQHGDGGLGKFQGEPLLTPARIREALERADGGANALAPSGGESGFYRLRAGRSLLLVDGGQALPMAGRQQGAHASALAFELSVGQARLVSNCGNFDLGADWQQLQRTTAAHSTLVWQDRNSAELLAGGGLGRRPSQILARQGEDEHAYELQLSHDGYVDVGGGTHYRNLRLRKNGLVLEGEDRLEGADAGTALVRFHLDPKVRAQMTQTRRSALLRLSLRERGWRFEVSSAVLQIGESVIADENGAPQRAQQLILAPAYDGLRPEDRAMRWRFYQEGAPL